MLNRCQLPYFLQIHCVSNIKNKAVTTSSRTWVIKTTCLPRISGSCLPNAACTLHCCTSGTGQRVCRRPRLLVGHEYAWCISHYSELLSESAFLHCRTLFGGPQGRRRKLRHRLALLFPAFLLFSLGNNVEPDAAKLPRQAVKTMCHEPQLRILLPNQNVDVHLNLGINHVVVCGTFALSKSNFMVRRNVKTEQIFAYLKTCS